MALTPLTKYQNFGMYRVLPPAGWPATVATGTTWQSDLCPAGFGNLVFAVTSNQVVTLQLQRYADLAGLCPVGALATQALTANTAGYVGVNDGLPFLSFNLLIVNASGSLATIAAIAAVTGPAAA